MEEQVETIESKEVIKQEAAVKIQSMFRGFKVNRERRFIVCLTLFGQILQVKLTCSTYIFTGPRRGKTHKGGEGATGSANL